MLAYEQLADCRMAFLTAELDDPHAAACGRCDVCAGPWYPTEVTLSASRGAQTALDRVGVPLPPRALWPSGLDTLNVKADGGSVKGRITPDELLAEGRAVARLSDLGWGAQLRELFSADREGNPVDREVPAELGRACLRVLKEWGWEERPVAVAWVPSLGRPRLVESLATGIAATGRLEVLGPLGLSSRAGRLRGSTNSAYRVRDVWDRFVVPPDLAARLESLDGPVLLVDDLVDSRWTMTVAGRLLRRAGARAVLPLALGAVG